MASPSITLNGEPLPSDYGNDISIGDMVKDTLEQLNSSTDHGLTESEESQCDGATD